MQHSAITKLPLVCAQCGYHLVTGHAGYINYDPTWRESALDRDLTPGNEPPSSHWTLTTKLTIQ